MLVVNTDVEYGYKCTRKSSDKYIDTEFIYKYTRKSSVELNDTVFIYNIKSIRVLLK